MIKYKNIEEIIAYLLPLCKSVIKMEKYDGISIECYVPEKVKVSKGMKEITKICTDTELANNSMEENKEKANVFLLQFPNLNPKYSEEQIKDMYFKTFDLLLSNARSNKEIVVTKELLLKFKNVITKNAIEIFCKSNLNLYKENINNYINNPDYRYTIDMYFEEFVDGYLLKNK